MRRLRMRRTGATMSFTRIVQLIVTLTLSVPLLSCRTLPRLEAVPSDQTERAVIPGIPNSRFWLDSDLSPFIQSVVQDLKREQETFAQSETPTGSLPPIYLLGISGGGEDGAFAAGLLAGWSRH